MSGGPSGGGGKEEVGYVPVMGTFFKAMISLCYLPALDDLAKELEEGTSGGRHAH